jgi:hypothetical protein
VPLVGPAVIANAEDAWSKPGGCRDKVSHSHSQLTSYILKGTQIIACNSGGSNTVCSAAQIYCNQEIYDPLSGIWDPYYVPTARPDPYPPVLEPYLHNPAVTSKIGSKNTWLETSYDIYYQFRATGDLMRSARPALEEVINHDVRTVIYAGDADYVVNYIGVEAMVRARVLSFPPTPFRVFWPLH